ncbi:MAG: hypothetical protein QM749_04415 [Aquabacterium sp.]
MQLIETLDRTRFSSANFEISYGDGSMNPLVEICFLPNRSFDFTIEFAGATKDRFLSKECPGTRFISTQIFDRNTFDDCLAAILRWVERITEEFAHQNPMYDEFLQFKDAIDKKLAEHVQDETMHFTRLEADELAAKLDALIQRVCEMEARLGNDFNTDAAEVLVRDIETLKSDTEVLPKGAWYRKAGAKVIGFVKAVATSKEAKQLAYEAAKQALLPGP